jgi:hypothetical protein
VFTCILSRTKPLTISRTFANIHFDPMAIIVLYTQTMQTIPVNYILCTLFITTSPKPIYHKLILLCKFGYNRRCTDLNQHILLIKITRKTVKSQTLKHTTYIVLELGQLTSRNTTQCHTYATVTWKTTLKPIPSPEEFLIKKHTNHTIDQNLATFKKLQKNTLCTITNTYTHSKQPYTKIQHIWTHKLPHLHQKNYHLPLRLFLTKSMWTFIIVNWTSIQVFIKHYSSNKPNTKFLSNHSISLQKTHKSSSISLEQQISNYTTLPTEFSRPIINQLRQLVRTCHSATQKPNLSYQTYPPTTSTHNHHIPTPKSSQYHNQDMSITHKIYKLIITTNIRYQQK